MSSEDKHTTKPRGATCNNKKITQRPSAGRKRPRGGCEDGRGTTTTTKREEQQQAYYDRLVHQCRKELQKQAKQTKTFLTQKLIRKLKELTCTSSSSNDGTAVVSSASSRELQEQKLQQLKDYELEPVLDECFRRLGLCQLDPKLQKISLPAKNEVLGPSKKEDDSHKPEENGSQSQQTPETIPPTARNENEKANNNDEYPDPGAGPTLLTTAAVVASSPETKSNSCGGWIRERILQHSRMMVALEHWNEQVTEYRRWCLQQQERAEGVWTTTNTRTKKMPAKRLQQDKNNSNDYDGDNALVAADHSVFVMLGGEDNAASANNDGTATEANGNYYGPGGSDGAMAVKQNRKGQRARRAKAQAVEARKAGRGFRPEESLNWRRSRKHAEHEQQPQQPSQQRQHHSQSVQNKPQPAIKEIPKEELHPSWQAHKEKKDGIVAFEGKKIRFD